MMFGGHRKETDELYARIIYGPFIRSLFAQNT